MIRNIALWLENTLHLSGKIQNDLISSIIIILVLFFIRRLVLKIAFRRVKDVRKRYRWRKTSAYTAFIFGLIFISQIWIRGFNSLSTYLGLLSAGIAIALKDPIVNLAGWAFIIWRKPFEVGDRIEIGGHAGDVIDQRIFEFTLMEIGNWVHADQSTGRIIHVPNGKIFAEVMANYSKGFQYIWNEIPVLITFESDWQKAKKILISIVKKHSEHLTASAEKKVKAASRKFMIFFSNLTPTVYSAVKDNGVLLTMRYLCEPRQRRGSEQAIWEDVLQEFSKYKSIEFAYPTTRFYNNLSESKNKKKK
ncbi:MAG: mechanosensitive ion channel family protein [Spirochaetes bacterium]|nr:mechanosensitive ion channel family protein [Spirochaetota bacterium]